MKKFKLIIIVILFITMIGVAYYSNQKNSLSNIGEDKVIYEIEISNVKIDMIDEKSNFSLSIKNVGDRHINSIYLILTLYDEEKNIILDKEITYVVDINKNETRDFTLSLNEDISMVKYYDVKINEIKTT